VRQPVAPLNWQKLTKTPRVTVVASGTGALNIADILQKSDQPEQTMAKNGAAVTTNPVHEG
jgi:hypothetical protein